MYHKVAFFSRFTLPTVIKLSANAQKYFFKGPRTDVENRNKWKEKLLAPHKGPPWEERNREGLLTSGGREPPLWCPDGRYSSQPARSAQPEHRGNTFRKVT